MRCERGTSNMVGIEGGSDAGTVFGGDGSTNGRRGLDRVCKALFFCVLFCFRLCQIFVVSWFAELISYLFWEVEKKDFSVNLSMIR